MESAEGTGERASLGLDSSVLSPFARAGRLEELARLTAPYQCVITEEIREELRRGQLVYPAIADAIALPWILLAPTDAPEVLAIFGSYLRALGSSGRNRGEASILAWAELTKQPVLIDDDAAVQAGRRRSVRVLRSLSLVATGLARGTLGEESAQTLVDELRRLGGARFPPECSNFVAWAERQGLYLPR